MPTLTLPTFRLPGLVRAALDIRRTRPPDPAPTPAPDPVRVPAPRKPVDHAPATGLPVPVDPDPVAVAGPQAQGDVIVLPWPDFMSPHIRYLHTGTAQPVPARGLTLADPHLLLAESGRVFWSWWPDSGPTLGTLVVPDQVVARLAHDVHADLRIAPGVYTVRRQRRDTYGQAGLVLD